LEYFAVAPRCKTSTLSSNLAQITLASSFHRSVGLERTNTDRTLERLSDAEDTDTTTKRLGRTNKQQCMENGRQSGRL